MVRSVERRAGGFAFFLGEGGGRGGGGVSRSQGSIIRARCLISRVGREGGLRVTCRKIVKETKLSDECHWHAV